MKLAKISKNDSFIESKAEKALKKREKIKELQKKLLGGDEPTINPLDYRLTLIQAMNFYNIYTNDDQKKKWVLASIQDKAKRAVLSKLDDCLFKQLGVIVRLQERAQFLEETELAFIKNKIENLYSLATIPEPVSTKPKNVVSIQDRVRKIASDFASEIDAELEEFMKLDYPKTFTFKSSVKAISGQAAKIVPEFFKSQIEELEEVLGGSCEQLNESYSHIKTIQVKRMLQLLTDLVSSCTQQVVSAKKPRTIKQKAPADLVKNVKYLPKFDELGLKSESPIKVIGCSEAWVYDTLRRRLSVYRSVDDQQLTFKGTTIIGYDVETSKIKTVRDASTISNTLSMNKKELKLYFESFKTKAIPPNGRINENVIILKTFK